MDFSERCILVENATLANIQELIGAVNALDRPLFLIDPYDLQSSPLPAAEYLYFKFQEALLRPQSVVLLKDLDLMCSLQEDHFCFRLCLGKLMTAAKICIVATTSSILGREVAIISLFDEIVTCKGNAPFAGSRKYTHAPSDGDAVIPCSFSRLVREWCNDHDRKRMQNMQIPFTSGLILYGPPGTGKTMAVKQFCAAFSFDLVEISMHEVLRAEVGHSESRLRNVFASVEDESKTVVFIDELDAVFSRSSRNERLVFELCSVFQTKKRNTLVIGATNSIESVPDALLGRGRFEICSLYQMSPGERRGMLTTYLSDKGLDLDESCINSILLEYADEPIANMIHFINRLRVKFCMSTEDSLGLYIKRHIDEK